MIVVLAQSGPGIDPSLVSVVAVLLSGGLITAWVAARRAPAQNELDTVQGMKVLVTELREELDRAQEKQERLERALGTLMDDRNAWRERALTAETQLGI